MPEIGGTVNGPTLMTTPTANGGADFTIPSKLYSFVWRSVPCKIRF